MRLKGKIVRWKNDKGFGFIEPNNGMPDVFFMRIFFSTNPESRQLEKKSLSN